MADQHMARTTVVIPADLREAIDRVKDEMSRDSQEPVSMGKALRSLVRDGLALREARHR